ncbi:MAG: hypothetical protein A3B96_03045 [Candidatus Spechtbacteria bacterium RIFCSPHIGHO2_02_FULL_43_15b]|nr:MAG: hypothetical protein A3B96_03045 [Candidatus Spechtbacteria bacterium RIFCSPHIGHO2_02_FULL_43_15b]
MRTAYTAYDITFFQEARRAAQNSSMRKLVGAVVVSRGKPVGTAFNRVGSAKLFFGGRTFISPFSRHAEIRAVIQAGISNISGSTLYVWRNTKDGTPALARPCGNCMAILQILGVKRVAYTTNAHPFYEVEAIPKIPS